MDLTKTAVWKTEAIEKVAEGAILMVTHVEVAIVENIQRKILEITTKTPKGKAMEIAMVIRTLMNIDHQVEANTTTTTPTEAATTAVAIATHHTTRLPLHTIQPQRLLQENPLGAEEDSLIQAVGSVAEEAEVMAEAEVVVTAAVAVAEEAEAASVAVVEEDPDKPTLFNLKKKIVR